MSSSNRITRAIVTYNDRYDFMEGVTHEVCYHYMFTITFIFFVIS